jgi:hypothetical protein
LDGGVEVRGYRSFIYIAAMSNVDDCHAPQLIVDSIQNTPFPDAKPVNTPELALEPFDIVVTTWLVP